MNGKGSKPRRRQVSRTAYEESFDQTFGRQTCASCARRCTGDHFVFRDGTGLGPRMYLCSRCWASDKRCESVKTIPKHSHEPRPKPRERWRLKRSAVLKGRRLSGALVTVDFVMHCNSAEFCYAVVSDELGRSGLTVKLAEFATRVGVRCERDERTAHTHKSER